MFNGCDLAKAKKERSTRLDFKGQTIKVAYENWDPFCIINPEDGSISGIIPVALNAMAAFLNVTIDYVPFSTRNAWGSQKEDGSWTGAIGDIHAGLIESSVAGFNPTLARSTVVDFTAPAGFSLEGRSILFL